MAPSFPSGEFDFSRILGDCRSMAERGGSRPGAGHPKGVRQATIDKAIMAEMAVVDAKLNGKPLAKDVLQQFMELFAGMAAAYQPLPPGAPPDPRRVPDEGRFDKYARLTVEVASILLPTQTPSLRAIQVFQPAGPAPAKPGDNAKLIDVKDANAVSREYQRIIQGPKP